MGKKQVNRIDISFWEVLVIFMAPQVLPESRTKKVLKIVKDAFGAWSKEISGIKYENKIRADAEKHFQNL